MAQVVLENLVKAYPDKHGRPVRAVNRISLAVADREFMVLLGPSGCGKTSTLRMIAGLEEITSGTVRIGDRVVNDIPPKDRDIAMVFQNYALYPHMTVRENLAFGLKLRKMPRRDIDRRVGDAAALLGLQDCLDRKPKALSGGQRQRVALGRAIVRKPKVFLFDEPLSNLDAKMRIAMRSELLKLRARLEATVIYVTHDQVEAMTMGDRICVMNGGSIQQVDRPLAVYRHPRNRFVAGFIGSPAMNLFAGRVREEDGRAVFLGEEAGAPAPAGGDALRLVLPPALASTAHRRPGLPLVLGIRPEHVGEAGAGRPPAAGPVLRAAVEIVEPMGAEAYLHAMAAGTPLIARVSPTAAHRPGDLVDLSFDLAEAVLFDAESGDAIG
ncbi:MAG: ABC transporter ATP-binding protein [Opitutaceae bacterium]